MTEKDYLIALNMVRKLTFVKKVRLLKRFSRPSAVFKAELGDLCQTEGINEELAGTIISIPRTRKFAEELDLIRKNRIEIITIADDNYPEFLREIYDPPLVLYLKGDAGALKKEKIAIVGCRRASFYGLEQAERLGASLGLRGICVVSGLARGIDTAAHRGALKFNGTTVAVLGSGLLNVYPPENAALAESIIDKSGALISEFPLQTRPLKENFPCRNRIISGLCRGVVVVEAAQRSGSLITANLALSQNREVYAVPGAANSVNAQGTNKLIKDGAKLVEGIDDILEDLPADFSAVPPDMGAAGRPGILNEEEEELLAILTHDPMHIDALVKNSGRQIGWVYNSLLGLQVKGFVKELEGKRFVRKGGR